MNCAQVKEQVVEYLYGELSAPARSAFVEHLRGCPGCKAEVAGHEQTLGRTRTALTGPLWQEPPARVRLAVLEAAKTQARSLRRAASEDRPGFFARLLRTPWLLPAFGAASVATVIFVVRVLKNPEVVPGQVPSTLLEESVPAPEPHAPAPPAAAPAAPEGAAKLDDLATQGLRPREEARTRRQAKGAAGKPVAPKPAGRLKRELPAEFPRGAGTASDRKAGGFAEPPPSWEPRRKAAKSIDDLLGGVKDERPVPLPAEATATPQRSRPAPERDEERAFGHPPTMAEPMAEKKTAEAVRQPASPFPSLAPPQPAATPPSAAPSPPPAPAAPASVHTAPPKSRRTDMDVTEGEASAPWEPTDKEVAKAKAPAGGQGAGPALEESMRKADRLYANRNWTAAVAAYRDLLRRFPGHKDAARWRARMNQSLVAEQQSRNSRDARAGKAAKAKSADAFEMEMK